MYTDATSTDDSQHVIHVEGFKAMVFKVRACASAHMRMAGIYDVSFNVEKCFSYAKNDVDFDLQHL